MFGSIGITEILIIMFILLILFGGKKLPELARGIGGGIKELKNSVKDIEEEVKLEDK